MNRIVTFKHATPTKPSRPVPGWRTMAKNLAKTAYQAASEVARGGALLAGEERTQARLLICQACEAWRPEDQRCSECGCYTNWKTRLAAGECPLGKWEQNYDRRS